MYKKVESWVDLIQLEHKVLDYWKDKRIFEKLIEKNKNGRPWSFLDGPITANNPMGVHHAWGRSLKDAFQRYHAMNGRKLRYQNGFDCQGLWVEVEVEKDLGFKSKKDIENYGIENFVNKCKERVYKYSERIAEQSIRLGYWMDWDNSYFTMSDENNYTIWKFLKKCHERGLLYKGHDIMPWCPRCGTGISQHEMQEGYHETEHLSVVVAFKIAGAPNEYFLVWTTTPWTLTSNVAVAVNPSLDYVKVKQGNNYYYIVKKRAEVVLKKDEKWETVKELKGEEILALNLKYQGPYDELEAQRRENYEHIVIAWDEISEEEGTGIVHIAPGCGAEDFVLGKELKLPAICPIDEVGNFIEGFGWFEGKNASRVALDVKANLKEKKILYLAEKYKHTYPHCWRCKEELLFRLVDEWYIEMDSWRNEIKAIVEKIKWIPSFGRELEMDWLSNMHDWMISKKRYWGLALPIWECTACGHFEVIGSYEELKERAVDGWKEFEGNSPHRPWVDHIKIECSKCHSKISRIVDVGNPWLDAGIVPYSTVKYNTDRQYWEKWIPADLVLECFPGQFRNWFYSLLAMSTMMENIPPFKTLVGHALVRDANGEEMHKSKGNAIWFDEAAEEVGVDLLRWQYFDNDLVSNLNFSFEKIKQIRGKFFNTLWNSYAFYVNYARLSNYQPATELSDLKKRTGMDRWIIARLQLVIKECREGMENFDTRRVCTALENFLDELSNWYIRLNRRRFWQDLDNIDIVHAFETLFECLYTMIKLLAPLLPMFTEEIYLNMIRSYNPDAPESVHLLSYPEVEAGKIDQELLQQMDLVIKVTTAALSARQKAKIKTRQPLAKLEICLKDKRDQEAITHFFDLLKSELNIKEVELLGASTEMPVVLKVKPNFKLLGTEFKSQVNLIAEAIVSNEAAIVGQIKENSSVIKVQAGSAVYELTPNHLLIEEIEPAGKSTAAFNGGWLAVDTEITEELRREGLMREFLRRVQVLRKDIGLEASDRIKIIYQTSSKMIKEVVEQYQDYICDELLCVSFQYQDNITDGNEIKIDNDSLILGIKKAETV